MELVSESTHRKQPEWQLGISQSKILVKCFYEVARVLEDSSLSPVSFSSCSIKWTSMCADNIQKWTSPQFTNMLWELVERNAPLKVEQFKESSKMGRIRAPDFSFQCSKWHFGEFKISVFVKYSHIYCVFFLLWCKSSIGTLIWSGMRRNSR